MNFKNYSLEQINNEELANIEGGILFTNGNGLILTGPIWINFLGLNKT